MFCVCTSILVESRLMITFKCYVLNDQHTSNNPLKRTLDNCKFKFYCKLSPGEELKAKAPPETKLATYISKA